MNFEGDLNTTLALWKYIHVTVSINSISFFLHASFYPTVFCTLFGSSSSHTFSLPCQKNLIPYHRGSAVTHPAKLKTSWQKDREAKASCSQTQGLTLQPGSPGVSHICSSCPWPYFARNYCEHSRITKDRPCSNYLKRLEPPSPKKSVQDDQRTDFHTAPSHPYVSQSETMRGRTYIFLFCSNTPSQPNPTVHNQRWPSSPHTAPLERQPPLFCRQRWRQKGGHYGPTYLRRHKMLLTHHSDTDKSLYPPVPHTFK